MRAMKAALTSRVDCEAVLNFRRVSLDGLGGAAEDLEDVDVTFFVAGGSGELVDATSLVKKESKRGRSPSPLAVGLSLPAIPMRIWASRLDNWFGLSRR